MCKFHKLGTKYPELLLQNNNFAQYVPFLLEHS